MLRGENFRGRHKRHLIAILDDDRRRLQRDDGFSASHVAFQQAMHWEWAVRGRRQFHASTRFCAAVGLNGRMRFSASRILVFPDCAWRSRGGDFPSVGAARCRTDSKRILRISDERARGSESC